MFADSMKSKKLLLGSLVAVSALGITGTLMAPMAKASDGDDKREFKFERKFDNDDDFRREFKFEQKFDDDKFEVKREFKLEDDHDRRFSHPGVFIDKEFDRFDNRRFHDFDRFDNKFLFPHDRFFINDFNRGFVSPHDFDRFHGFNQFHDFDD